MAYTTAGDFGAALLSTQKRMAEIGLVSLSGRHAVLRAPVICYTVTGCNRHQSIHNCHPIFDWFSIPHDGKPCSTG
jgi:hypothetical protein